MLCDQPPLPSDALRFPVLASRPSIPPLSLSRRRLSALPNAHRLSHLSRADRLPAPSDTRSLRDVPCEVQTVPAVHGTRAFPARCEARSLCVLCGTLRCLAPSASHALPEASGRKSHSALEETQTLTALVSESRTPPASTESQTLHASTETRPLPASAESQTLPVVTETHPLPASAEIQTLPVPFQAEALLCPTESLTPPAPSRALAAAWIGT